ncbi:PLATZ transcription factor [Musa troglodytarum]|uniref:PLATZ transcription factor n=2 Tax=Musa troglodytarum TaxID=320322 RepID=A0A9E7HW01_9LILI|nr:PLATZ transcription factor [Musa troglodytarum]
MPGWLGGLVEESFFVGCGTHENRRKNEKNIFCLGCCTSICPHCVPAHPSHPLSRVRRYVYNDVVRLEDLEKLIDCSFVQPYTINSAKVVFLKPRPQSRPSKVAGNTCSTCDRILQEPFRFCSLSCKVDHVLLQGEDLSSILFRFDESELAFSRFENLRMDNSDLLLDDDDGRGSSGTKKNKSNAGFFPQIVLSLNNRRKGAPHRSPLS